MQHNAFKSLGLGIATSLIASVGIAASEATSNAAKLAHKAAHPLALVRHQ